MMRWIRGTLLLLAVGAVGGMFDGTPEGAFTGAVSAKPPGPKGPKKGKDHLQKAYDALTDVAVWMRADKGRPPRETTKLFDQARSLYRDAVRATQDEDDHRANELALASHDAARGLMHALRAEASAASGIPAPPPRSEDDELDNLLRRTSERLREAEDAGERGPGRAFLEAARRLYERARRADQENSARTLQLARAAEAWTHVGEHLDRAEERDVRRPPEPERRRPRPPRGSDRETPPPPPPE